MPKPPDPLVSVIIPCRDVVEYLPEAIESAREQGVSPLEVVVVDDGSVAPCAEIARAAWSEVVLRVHETPRGPAAARNTGLDAARGRYVAFLDADDVWAPGGLARQLTRLEERRDAYFITGQTEVVGMPTSHEGGRRIGRVLRAGAVELLLPATVFRREAFDLVGRLDPALRFGEDSDWFLRAREMGVPYLTTSEVYLYYRRHDRNMTCGRGRRELFIPQTIIRSLRRRREAGTVRTLPSVPGPTHGNA